MTLRLPVVDDNAQFSRPPSTCRGARAGTSRLSPLLVPRRCASADVCSAWSPSSTSYLGEDERDLHDGAQQRLVSLALQLHSVGSSVPPGLDEPKAQLSRASVGLARAVRELQELSRGIHRAIVSKGGLGPASRTLARRAAVPVEVAVSANGRLPERVE